MSVWWHRGSTGKVSHRREDERCLPDGRGVWTTVINESEYYCSKWAHRVGVRSHAEPETPPPTANWPFEVFKFSLRTLMVIREGQDHRPDGQSVPSVWSVLGGETRLRCAHSAPGRPSFLQNQRKTKLHLMFNLLLKLFPWKLGFVITENRRPVCQWIFFFMCSKCCLGHM